MSDPRQGWEEEFITAVNEQAIRADEVEQQDAQEDELIRRIIQEDAERRRRELEAASRIVQTPTPTLLPQFDEPFAAADFSIAPRALYCCECYAVHHRFSGIWYHFGDTESRDLWGTTWGEYWFGYLRFTCMHCHTPNTYEFSIQREAREHARTAYNERHQIS